MTHGRGWRSFYSLWYADAIHDALQLTTVASRPTPDNLI